MNTSTFSIAHTLGLLTMFGIALVPLLTFAQAPSGAQEGLVYQKGNPRCKVISVTVQIQGGAPVISNPVPNPDPEAKDPCYSSATYLGLDGKPQALPSELEKALGGAVSAASQGFFGQLGQQLAQQLMQSLFGGGSGGGGGGGGTGVPSPSAEPNTVDQINNAFDSGQLNTDTTASGPLETTYDKLLKSLFARDPEIEKEATKGATPETGASTTSGQGGVGSEPGSTGTGGSGNEQDTTPTRPAGIGSIRADGTGGVLVVDVSKDDSGIVGFFGSSRDNTFAGQSASPIGRLCSAQPWKGSFVSYVIPDRFFDGLCSRLGYTPGQQIVVNTEGAIDTTVQERAVVGEDVIKAAQPSAPTRGIMCEPGIIDIGSSAQIRWSCDRAALAQVAGFRPNSSGEPSVVSPTETTTYGILCDDGVVSQCTVTVANPRVTIWSEPEEITLGTRATIFWYAEDVTNCSVDGPSFHETGVQGGASTVPITEATEFTATCQSLSGATTTKSFIADLAL